MIVDLINFIVEWKVNDIEQAKVVISDEMQEANLFFFLEMLRPGDQV